MILSSLTALSEVLPLFIVRSFSQASRGIALFSYNVPPLAVRRSPHRLQSRRVTELRMGQGLFCPLHVHPARSTVESLFTCHLLLWVFPPPHPRGPVVELKTFNFFLIRLNHLFQRLKLKGFVAGDLTNEAFCLH